MAASHIRAQDSDTKPMSPISDAASITRAMSVLNYECSFVARGMNPPHPQDAGFPMYWAAFNFKNLPRDVAIEHMAVIMDGLRWRFSVQELVLSIWAHLVAHKVLPLDTMTQPIDLENDSIMYGTAVMSVVKELAQYPYFEEATSSKLTGILSRNRSPSEGSLRGEFAQALQWLAVLVLRSNSHTEARAIFQHMEALLLSPSALRLQDVPPINLSTLPYNPLFAISHTVRGLKNTEFGFMLPHGELRQWAQDTVQRYTAVREAYLDLFGRDSWPINQGFCKILTKCSMFGTPEDVTLAAELGQVFGGMKI